MLKKEIEKYLNPGFFFLELLHDKNVKDKEDHHPETGVFNHTLQVFYLLKAHILVGIPTIWLWSHF